MEFIELMEDVALLFELAGVAIILVGGTHGLIRAALVEDSDESYYERARTGFGRPLLLGLEVLVAADIIETVTVSRTLESVTSLGILVLTRVVLSFALDIEIDGVLPWQRARLEAERERRRTRPT